MKYKKVCDKCFKIYGIKREVCKCGAKLKKVPVLGEETIASPQMVEYKKKGYSDKQIQILENSKEWEKKVMSYGIMGACGCMYAEKKIERLKNLILSLLRQEREKVLSEIRKAMPKKEIYKKDYFEAENLGFNACRSLVLEILNKLE